MKKTALIVMAAGIGSRYGAGIKQLAKIGPFGEIILDYSVHDALEAGFDKLIFVIRKDIETEFRDVIGKRIEKIADVHYAFQELTALPKGYSLPDGRTKPWGTAHALMQARNMVDCPFAVINADERIPFPKTDPLIAVSVSFPKKAIFCPSKRFTRSREKRTEVLED